MKFYIQTHDDGQDCSFWMWTGEHICLVKPEATYRFRKSEADDPLINASEFDFLEDFIAEVKKYPNTEEIIDRIMREVI